MLQKCANTGTIALYITIQKWRQRRSRHYWGDQWGQRELSCTKVPSRAWRPRRGRVGRRPRYPWRPTSKVPATHPCTKQRHRQAAMAIAQLEISYAEEAPPSPQLKSQSRKTWKSRATEAIHAITPTLLWDCRNYWMGNVMTRENIYGIIPSVSLPASWAICSS